MFVKHFCFRLFSRQHKAKEEEEEQSTVRLWEPEEERKGAHTDELGK